MIFLKQGIAKEFVSVRTDAKKLTEKYYRYNQNSKLYKRLSK